MSHRQALYSEKHKKKKSWAREMERLSERVNEAAAPGPTVKKRKIMAVSAKEDYM